ncbi:N-acetylglutaminylglutamine amidotransferase [Desulfohalovibrio reitneri]|uniref:N-acetylglutaminylglutamine amidotransferase n=1 Tax=Desulfohalovibrio reitneri TaxID=1307759 RepID=UPI0004A729C2|nr:N-acetylglutaminylglutamine amidotransferase [Desulfohalovibrio reitneri]
MCGICGEIRLDSEEADVSAVAAMARCMSPRGPDGRGLRAQGAAAFGHRRLKIIDLSEKAAQPMVDPELGLSIVFNGCIYNYKELREELQGKGYRFFSSGDTEVLIKAYHAWGDGFVERLQGMFALAVWERDSGRVLLARDRLGIKPLYFSRVDGAFRFASTLPALLASGGVDDSIDPEALHHYLTFHAVVPAPLTILRGVRKLEPGHTMVVEEGRVGEPKRWWDADFGPTKQEDQQRSEEEWQELVLEAMRLSVERRLTADVPVGVLLSGGLDSSLVVGLLAKAGQRGLETFSIGFETVGDEEGDEFKYSDVVAREFGTRHHKLRISPEETLKALPGCVAAMSEPMVSHDNVGFYLLSREVSRHVKVVQSGQGADEVFGGYHWYPPLLDSADPVADYSKVFFDRDREEYLRAVRPEHLSPGDAPTEFVRRAFETGGSQRAIDKALKLDTTVMLTDDPVKRVDNMTMAWGLEARVPFLDHELVEMAGRIPAELKVKSGGKHVLKEAARRVIPAEVIDRPKGYFPVPALKYLRGPFLESVRDVLHAPEAKRRGLFHDDYVRELLDAPEEHITPLRGSKLWQLGLLEMWLQAQGVK